MDRPRRLRRSATMRRMVAETTVRPEQLILPVFVSESASEPRQVPSMPGIWQHTTKSISPLIDDCVEAGIAGVMIFAIPAHKDSVGSQALNPDGILTRVISQTRDQVGDSLLVMSDVCLDEFTSHGHCGIIDEHGNVDNDATVERYARMAVLHAEAGAHVVAPSGMMDGQVRAIRSALDKGGWIDTAIMAYAAKYASAFYGPFRDAVDSSFTGDRNTYQQDPANRREARRESLLDQAEGADIVMVKPAVSYLDIISDIRAATDLPVAGYNVSGEYAMVEAAAQAGWLERDRARDEMLLSIVRAGADIVLSYWALEWALEQRS